MCLVEPQRLLPQSCYENDFASTAICTVSLGLLWIMIAIGRSEPKMIARSDKPHQIQNAGLRVLRSLRTFLRGFQAHFSPLPPCLHRYNTEVLINREAERPFARLTHLIYFSNLSRRVRQHSGVYLQNPLKVACRTLWLFLIFRTKSTAFQSPPSWPQRRT